MSDATTSKPPEKIIISMGELNGLRRLIDLAQTIVNPERGNIKVHVPLIGDSEEELLKVENAKALVDEYWLEKESKDVRLEIITKVAPTISRSILDISREERADLLILQVPKRAKGKATLGAVAENVVPAAPCDVLLIRLGQKQDVARVMVPILRDLDSRNASQIGISIGRGLNLPIEATYFQSTHTDYWSGRGKIEAALIDIEGQESVKRTVVQSDNVKSALLSRIGDDIVVIPISSISEWDRWNQPDMAQTLLKSWSGTLIIAAAGAIDDRDSRRGKLRLWLTPTLTQFEQEEIVHTAEESATPSLDYIVLIIVSSILATFGLLLNSNAVIIGAMLVAPLMLPLIAFATGMTIGKLRLVSRSTSVLLQGILAAFLIAIFIGVVSPTQIITPEMAARGNPTFMDMAVALASGFLGAYATARKHIPSALAGVAIAAALMPPLSTIGLGLAFGDIPLAKGATLLFVANIVSIILAAWGTFFWLGMRPLAGTEDTRARRWTSGVLVFLFVVVLIGLTYQNFNRVFQVEIERVLRESFVKAELVSYEVRQTVPLEIFATIRQPASNINDTSEIITAKNALEETLEEEVVLGVIIQPIVDGDVAKVDAEIEQLLGETLRQTLQYNKLLRFIFEIGNPTLVIAFVEPQVEVSSEEFSQDIENSQIALTEALNLPVELSLIVAQTTESGALVEATNQEISETIETVLNETPEYSQLQEYQFVVGNPFIVGITVTTEIDPSSDEFLKDIKQTEAALSNALGYPIILTVTVIPSDTPTLIPTPPLFPLPTEVQPVPTEIEPTDEAPTPGPPTEAPTAEPPPEETETPTAEPTEELETPTPTSEVTAPPETQEPDTPTTTDSAPNPTPDETPVLPVESPSAAASPLPTP
jgi:uncharacterized hydrophobic protein (TIGR00271 family)